MIVPRVPCAVRAGRLPNSPRKSSPNRRELRPAYQIARATGLSPATVSRILRPAHLNRWRDLNPLPPVVRYEHPFPGDLLHLDIKGMTRYQQVSIRGDGRRRGRLQFAGWMKRSALPLVRGAMAYAPPISRAPASAGTTS